MIDHSDMVFDHSTFSSSRFYDLLPLAKGGEGRLVRARDRWTGRLTVLKIATSLESEKALLREYRYLSLLRHPCLIESIDLVRNGDRLTHVLEYVPALPQEAIWKQGGENGVLSAMIQALRGLDYLHRKGFVHCDVTPGNILVWKDGEKWSAKVADLGLMLPARLAARCHIRGTPGYMAPEVISGDGLTPASDLYSLAVTAVSWINGTDRLQHPRSSVRSLLGARESSKSRKLVPAELRDLIGRLGALEQEQRGVVWENLYRDEIWGPPVLSATIAGVEDTLRGWERWLEGIAGGCVAGILVKGQVGSGRRTLCRCMGRRLQTAGWSAIWDVPLARAFGAELSNTDPVEIVRELSSRFYNQNVVVLWPRRMTEIEMRVLRGFIVSREDTASGAKTLVLRTSGLFEDSKALWRDPYSNILEHEWRGPGSEAIRVICDDLFVEEVRGKALSATNDPEAVRTPLSAEMLKKSRLRGRLPGEENTGADGIEEELRWMWENLSKETQEAIALLSWSDSEWKFEELANTLGWNHALVSTTAASLRDSYVLDFRFEVSVEVIRISDWVTKECLSRISLSQVSRSRLRSIVTNIQRLGLHVDDLGLATSILQGGELPLAMLLSAVPVAIQEGRYEQILDLRRSLIPFKLEANPKESLWRQFSSAAHRLGNLPLEITLLEELIPWSREADARMKLELQRAEALASLGDWEGSVSVCEVIERTATDRYLKVRACLQRAEALWQSGNHDGATKAYEETKARLLPEMREEWLRYTIGRARQYGQIGRMKDVAAFLEEARRGVGESSCNANPLFLHTLGGLQLQTAEYRGARATLIKAMEIARSNENWKEFLMISMRAGSVESGLGNPRRAAELGREGLSISQALGSETITARVLASLAHAEMYLGKLGSAVRHSHQYLDTAVRKKDKTMEIQAHRLLAQIGAHGGFENLLHTSLSYLRKSSSKNDDIEAQARADLCQGIFYWGCGRYSEAAGALELAVNHFVEVGWKDDELEARLWLLRVQSELGRDVSGELVHLEAAIREAKSRLLCPLLSLLQIKLGVSDAVSAETIAEELWGNGRIMDVMEWLPDLGPAHGKALDRILLGAIQSTAESLVQPDLRRQFLSFPRTLAALRQIRD